MLNLKDKNLLVIMPFYFGYQYKIKKNMEKYGAKVFLIDEDYNEHNLKNKFLSVYVKNRYQKLVRKYYQKNFEKLPKRLDYILIIKGSSLSESEFEYLIKHYPNTPKIMYQWDSVKNFPEALYVAKNCDYCYTFDPNDAASFNWRYRPLFFDVNDVSVEEKIYDLTFIGSLHSKRAFLLKYLQRYKDKNAVTGFFFLFSNRWSFIRQKYIKKNSVFDIISKDINFQPLTNAETISVYNKSRCLVDYKFDGQDGLTMRTIESLGHKCKLITNNKMIVHEEFYNPDNIYIYDIDNFDIPLEFIRSNYVDIDNEIYRKYSIEGWISEILELDS